jgi:hypothetical protein
LLRALLLLTGLAALLYPIGAREVARRRAVARVERVRPESCVSLASDPVALGLRLTRLGPLLASWETIGGCGAGGATGTGVKWIGHNTTGGLFQDMIQNNMIFIPPSLQPGHGQGGFNYILNLQISKDFIFDPWRGAWNFSISLPYLYKHYNDFLGLGPVTNAGIGDTNVFLSRKVGTDNSTSLTLIGGMPTGTYRAEYMGTPLTPDQQLGFGRLTASLQVEHTFDQDWGLILTGGSLNYRGGQQSDKYLFFFNAPSQHNYRSPSASLYAYTGYFWGPLVPAAGAVLTGYRRQDTRGDFGETLDAPVATAAVHGSIEWSNTYVAILAGVYVPFAIRGTDWQTPPLANGGRYLQPWTVALGVSTSPF